MQFRICQSLSISEKPFIRVIKFVINIFNSFASMNFIVQMLKREKKTAKQITRQIMFGFFQSAALSICIIALHTCILTLNQYKFSNKIPIVSFFVDFPLFQTFQTQLHSRTMYLQFKKFFLFVCFFSIDHLQLQQLELQIVNIQMQDVDVENYYDFNANVIGKLITFLIAFTSNYSNYIMTV